MAGLAVAGDRRLDRAGRIRIGGAVNEHIRVEIKKGKVKIETSGFSGTACVEATKRLSQRLGKTLSDESKPEMFDNVVDQDVEVK